LNLIKILNRFLQFKYFLFSQNLFDTNCEYETYDWLLGSVDKWQMIEFLESVE
jgi:hypothetical protein